MQIKRREHPFDFNWRTSLDYRSKRPLFNDMDELGGAERLVDYAIGEVEEVKQEIDVEGQPNQEKIADELNDVYNMIVPISMMTYGRDFQPSQVLYGVNGDGAHSNNLDKLTEAIGAIETDKRAIIETYRLLWSISTHILDRDENTQVAQIMATYDKVSNNYPIHLYNGIDLVTGEPLAEEDKQHVFEHTTKGLKKIRKEVKRTLKPAQDLPPYYSYLADWRNSEQSLAALQADLVRSSSTEAGVAILPDQAAIASPEVTVYINKKSGILFSAS